MTDFELTCEDIPFNNWYNLVCQNFNKATNGCLFLEDLPDLILWHDWYEDGCTVADAMHDAIEIHQTDTGVDFMTDFSGIEQY